MTTDWYAPNQQAVRADGSGPAEEGTGGSAEPEADTQTGDDLDEMTKDQLLDEADALGVNANAAMNKDEIKAAIRAG